MNKNFIHLIDHLTQGGVKNSRNDTFTKTLKLREQRRVLSLLAQKVFYAKNKHPTFQQQLDDLSLELIKLSQQTATAPEQLNQLIKKYQELIRLILASFAGSSSDGAGAKLQMPILNKKNLRPNLVKVIKKINHLLEENTHAQQNPYQSIGDLVVNVIIGIFSFFMSDLEELDEQTKKELNKELTNYKQQQKNANNILRQTNLILNQLYAAPTPAPQSNKKADYFTSTPFRLWPSPGGGSSRKKNGE